MVDKLLLQWDESVVLSAHGGGGQLLSPEHAYFGMPEDFKIAAAVVDAAIWNYWGWVSTIISGILGEKGPTTLTRTKKYFNLQGWKDIDDAYDAANVTANQRVAFNLRLLGFTYREVGEVMNLGGVNPTHQAQMQCLRTIEKLKRICADTELE